MSETEITFDNQSGYPVNISGWKKIMYGLSRIESVTIKAGEQLIVHSSTGEWYIDAIFYEEDAEYAIWKKADFHVRESRLGKFRSMPCFRGDYSWMENDVFDAIYQKDKHTIIFIKK